MPLLDTDCPSRDRPYISSRVLAAANRIFAVLDDPTVPAPRSPPPTLPARGQAVFDRIMAACAPTTPAEVVDVRSSSAVPPPRKPRRR